MQQPIGCCLKFYVMNKIFFFTIVIIVFCTCDSNDKNIFNLERVKIGAILNNNNSLINLGDTLKVNVKLPNDLSSSSGVINIQSLQKAQFYMRIFKADTVNNIANVVSRTSFWTSKGSISSTNEFDFEFNNTNIPYEVIINFKPQLKGIYYFEVVSQAGQIKVNNAYEGRLIIDFNVPSRNVNLAAPFFTPAWVAEAQSREFGLYVFRVI